MYEGHTWIVEIYFATSELSVPLTTRGLEVLEVTGDSYITNQGTARHVLHKQCGVRYISAIVNHGVDC